MKKLLSLIFAMILVLSMAPAVFADDESYIDKDLWDAYFSYDTEKEDAELPQRCEDATEIYFGKKTDFQINISGLDGVSVASDESENIKVYESGTIYYVLAEDDGNIVFPEYSYDMFYGFSELTNISFGENIDTSNVLSMSFMFYDCENLTSIDLSNFVFNEEVGTYYIFEGCTGLEYVVFPAGTDMGLFTDEDPFCFSGKKFCGWYNDSAFSSKCTAETLTSATTLYPKFEDKTEIELDLTAQSYVLQSSEDVATFKLVGEYADLEGFEITYYFDWDGSEAYSNDGVYYSGDFDIEIYRPEDDDYVEYNSGRIEDALHVSGVLVYDGREITSGEVPVDNGIYEKGDEITIQEQGDMVKKGYIFRGWIYGSSLYAFDSEFYDGGEAAEYSGTTVTAAWELDYSEPNKENDYTLQVDKDAVDNIQWYRQNKGQFTLYGSDFADSEDLQLGIGEIDGDIIKSDEIWNEISLSIGSDVLDIDDTAVIYFNNLPENYYCTVNWEQVEIVDNKLTVTASWSGLYLDLETYDEITVPFEITKIECNGTITEKLEGETNNRIGSANKAGQYSVTMAYVDPLYGMDATITLGFIDAVKVSFDNNYANGSIAPVYNLPGRSITLPGGDVFNAYGYKMIGWNTKSNGTGTFYPLNGEFTVGDEDITLYAIWEPVYDNPVYTWNDDHTQCTASSQQLGNSNNTITEIADAVVSEKDGFKIYEVSFKDSRFEKQSYQEKLEEKKDEKTQEPTEDKKTEDSSNTEQPDDTQKKNNNVAIWVIAAVVICAVLVAVVIKSKKNKE